ncbi:MAG: hypothetical protein Q8Q29_05440 [Actinomycetota bacterium]|nr:hypothetical protein [Actinomycetota bacterium]
MARGPSNKAPTTETVSSFPPKVCKMLVGLAGARKTAKDRLNTLIGRRKDLDEELNELGAGHTEEHLETRSSMVLTLRGIDWTRARIRTLSDKIEELLLDPTQDWLWENLPDINRHDPDEALLFSAGTTEREPDDEEGDGDEDGEEPGEDPGQLHLVGGAAEPVGDPPAEPSGDDTAGGPAADELINSMLPGVFADQNGRKLPIGDREALEEVVNNAVGSVWHWEVVRSAAYGDTIHVCREQGGKVNLTLTRVGDIEAPKPAGKTPPKPAAKKPGKKQAAAKKPSKKPAG